MNRLSHLVSARLLTALATVLFIGYPSLAGVKADQQEFHVFVGGLFGDDLTDNAISGQKPELDDDVVFGLRYGYSLTDAWAIEASLSFSPNTVTGVNGSDIDMDIYALDVDAVWHFARQERAAEYVTFGAGYAQADLDHAITGLDGNREVVIDDDGGFTLNAGVGAKYFITDTIIARADARYRYVDKLIGSLDTSLNSLETSAGIGFAF